jgi:hypothetical protein
MMRPFTLLCFVAFAGAGAWLYQVKHAVTMKDRELVEIRRQTEAARQRIDVLRAEWALLNEPERLRQTAQRMLTLDAMQPQHFARPHDFERRLPPAVAFAGPPNIFAAAPVQVAAAPASAATPAAEAPAPQALAATVAAQRAEQASRPPRPPAPPRPAARAPEPAPILPVSSPPAGPPPGPLPSRPPRPAAPETAIASALGAASGRPLLAPPVPISPAAAATLNGR